MNHLADLDSKLHQVKRESGSQPQLKWYLLGMRATVGTIITSQLGEPSMSYHMEEPDYKLEVRQQPVYARVAIGKEKGTLCSKHIGSNDEETHQ